MYESEFLKGVFGSVVSSFLAYAYGTFSAFLKMLYAVLGKKFLFRRERSFVP